VEYRWKAGSPVLARGPERFRAILTERSPIALEIVIDLDRRRDHRRSAARGALQGEKADGEIVDFDLKLIDARLGFDHLFQARVAFLSTTPEYCDKSRSRREHSSPAISLLVVPVPDQVAQSYLKLKGGNIESTKAARDVVFRIFLPRVLKDLASIVKFNQFAHEEKSGVVRQPGRLLHVWVTITMVVSDLSRTKVLRSFESQSGQEPNMVHRAIELRVLRPKRGQYTSVAVDHRIRRSQAYLICLLLLSKALRAPDSFEPSLRLLKRDAHH